MLHRALLRYNCAAGLHKHRSSSFIQVECSSLAKHFTILSSEFYYKMVQQTLQMISSSLLRIQRGLVTAWEESEDWGVCPATVWVWSAIIQDRKNYFPLRCHMFHCALGIRSRPIQTCWQPKHRFAAQHVTHIPVQTSQPVCMLTIPETIQAACVSQPLATAVSKVSCTP